ncbi:Os09g0483000 [Oryza sativa Japonica Group]|uniref:Os09g0483000 protein n=1 Tax=Oryza sativa subsp. japonica TaxID=39947 RepID=A0A0P0XNB8_ORYSJ|nr:Os09g0483000 [Oryza sativa Japonica Group]
MGCSRCQHRIPRRAPTEGVRGRWGGHRCQYLFLIVNKNLTSISKGENIYGYFINTQVPQLDVLCHLTTDTFVTHYGWNLVQKGIITGMPMLYWPLYVELTINKVLKVDYMGIDVEMEGWLVGLVIPEEVKVKVRLIIESEH